MEFNATFIVSLVSFLVFTFVMNKILYQPITKIVDEREKLINDNHESALLCNEKVCAIHSQKESRLAEVAAENKKMTAEKLHEANILAKNKTNEAKRNSVEQINNAKSVINDETITLNNEINGRIDEFANIICSKVLGDV